MQNTSKKSRLVFDFVRPPSQRLNEIESGKAPREFFGYIQLQEKGWPVSYSDDRWNGTLGKLRQKLTFAIEVPSLKMIAQWRKADIVIVTTRLSLILSLIAKALGKKIVFLDAMCEEVPKKLWRRLVAKYALILADASICVSSSQAKHWAADLGISEDAFNPVFCGADINFYKLPDIANSDEQEKHYLLAVGRDPGRDFLTLVNAAEDLGWNVKIVTQPYLVPDGVRDKPHVQILSNLSYDELFKVYAKAAAVVVPVKVNTTYMSGIRATMEAMSLGVPVIASRVPGMLDYFTEGQELLYFEPENKDDLVKVAKNLVNDVELRTRLTQNAKHKIYNSYTVENYVNMIEGVLLSIQKKG